MDMRRYPGPLTGCDYGDPREATDGQGPEPEAAEGQDRPGLPGQIATDPAQAGTIGSLQMNPGQAMSDETGGGQAGEVRPIAGGAQAAWLRVRGRICREIGKEAFASWLNPMVLHSAEAGEILLALPSRFMRDWVANHYAERLKALWQVEWPATRSIVIRVQPRARASAQPSPASASPGLRLSRPAAKEKSLGQAAPRAIALARRRQAPEPGTAPGGAARSDTGQGDTGQGDTGQGDTGQGDTGQGDAGLRDGMSGDSVSGIPVPGSSQPDDAPPRQPPPPPRGDAGEAYGGYGQGMFGINQGGALDRRNTFETFIVGRSNELAHAAARRVAGAERYRVPFNPLFLYGGVGLGKTHLMHAIAWHIRQRDPDRRVMYLSAESFMYHFVSALRFKDTMAFKQQFRSVDVLMIDDVQFIAGKDSTQEEFFHIFNALCDQNRQIVISGDRSPADLEGMEERMRSRLGWGLVADIHPTDYELRLSILQSKVDQIDIDVPRNVLEFLAHRITANIRELEGALNRVAAFASLVGRPVELEMAQEVLRDQLRASDRRITIEEIQKRVAEHYNIKLSDMHSPRRAIAVARPRQIAMYLAKHLTTRSLPEIGRKFGNRDHTTVMHAVKRIEQLQGQDNDLAEDVVLLRRILAS